MKKLFLLSLAGISLPLLATEVDEKIKPAKVELKAITISGSIYEKRWQDIPATVYRNNEDDNRLKLQAFSVADSLRETAGITIQKTGPGRETPLIRGFTTSRNVIIADGVRVNNPMLREGPNEYWNTLDPFVYGNSEVVMGAGSLLYGSDAAGGVVLLGSRPLTRGEEGSGLAHVEGDIYFRYSGADNSFSEHLSTEFTLDDDWAFRVGVTRQDFGDLRTGDGNTNANTDYEQWGANLRAQYFIDNNSSFVMGYDHFDMDGLNRWHRTTDFESWHGTIGRGSKAVQFRQTDFDRRSGFLRYELRDGDGLVQEADFGISVQYMSEFQHRRNPDGSDKDKLKWDDTTYGIYGRLMSETSIGDLTYGFDYYYDDINSSKPSDPSAAQGVVADDSKYHQFGIYLQDEIALSDRLKAVVGSRFSYVRLNANQVESSGASGVSSQENDWHAFTSSARLVYRLSDDESTHIYAGISQGFRAPNLSDTTRVDEVASDATESPSFDLDPEYYTTYEAGLRIEEENYDLRLAVYRTDIEDLIVRLKNDSTGNTGKENVNDAYVTGIELSGSYDITNSVTAFGFVAYQEGYTDDYANGDYSQGSVDDHWTKMSPLNGQAGLRWQSSNKALRIEGYVNFADGQDKLSRGDNGDTSRIPPGGTPGFVTYNLRSTYRINKDMNFALSFENISDESYRIHGSGNNGAGRHVTGTLHYKF